MTKVAATFTDKHRVRIRVWMRDHATDFTTADDLAEEACWLFNAYCDDDGIPVWIRELADELMKEKARV